MRLFKLFLFGLLFWACNSDDGNVNCNFLIDVNVNVNIDLNLPQFNQLNFTNGVVYLPNEGNGGVYVIRSNSQTILAWDGADPNFTVSSCSIMSLDGTIVSSTCGDGNQFSLITGGPIGDNPPPCGLKPYRVQPLSGNSYQITN